MQFFTILPIAFCLAASTLSNPIALPEKYHRGVGGGPRTKEVSPQVKANVSAQIDKWLRDIESVNNFVDTISSITNPAVISSMAATAFVAAQNEGASNAILQQDVKLDAPGQAAAQALIGKFNIIGPAINDTISNPGNVQKNLDAINGARCPPPQGAGAISEEGEVQAAAASAAGITVPPPQTPTACTAAAAATSCE
ncbi:hypothetical protein OIDMADRAFT_62085 [Oidiodendron maius Zn]|uniref:Uncharacterized protein n=1 Tax=Oidiodendron maius (strain Zn) TaxID=913774 RepID=A0A0C3GR46_OIDMZ|nr:hypothetical protein OIDMADRAFT_62085 [Oidiodendron maius Zn]